MAELILIFCLLSLVIAGGCYLLTYDFKLQHLSTPSRILLNALKIVGSLVVITQAVRTLIVLSSLPHPIPQLLIATVISSPVLLILCFNFWSKSRRTLLTTEESDAIKVEMQKQEFD